MTVHNSNIKRRIKTKAKKRMMFTYQITQFNEFQRKKRIGKRIRETHRKYIELEINVQKILFFLSFNFISQFLLYSFLILIIIISYGLLMKQKYPFILNLKKFIICVSTFCLLKWPKKFDNKEFCVCAWCEIFWGRTI